MVPMSIFGGLLGIVMVQGIDCCNFGLLFCFDGGGRCGNWSRGNRPVLPVFLTDSLMLNLHWANGYPV